MSHMVIYRAADGKPGYHQTDEILDAVTYVERLRNEQAVEHARIFRLEEVQFEFRPYYRVELTSSVGGTTLGSPERRAVPEVPAELDADLVPETSWAASVSGASYLSPAESVVEETSIGVRRGLFGR